MATNQDLGGCAVRQHELDASQSWSVSRMNVSWMKCSAAKPTCNIMLLAIHE